MSAIATILLGIAAKVGAPIVKSILQEHIGGMAGEVGGQIIDAVAKKAGVSPIEIEDVPQQELEKAVLEVERTDAPELLQHLLESQRLSHELMKKEMDSGPFWSWAWRPGGMYLIGLFWLLYVLVYPMLNLFLRLFGARAELQTMVDVATLLAISGGFISLYMGGYTVLKGVEKWKGRQQ